MVLDGIKKETIEPQSAGSAGRNHRDNEFWSFTKSKKIARKAKFQLQSV